MVRSMSRWTLAVILLGFALVNPGNRADGQSAIQPGATVSIQEKGQTMKCRVLSNWQTQNGSPAFKVQVIASGEILTVMQERSIAAAKGAPQPMRIWHWRGNAPPAGCPIEPGTVATTPTRMPVPSHPQPHTASAPNQSWNTPKILSESAPTIVQVSPDPLLPRGTTIVSQPVCKHGKTNCPICSPDSYTYQSDKLPQFQAPATIAQKPAATTSAAATQPNLVKTSTTVVVTPSAPRPATAQLPTAVIPPAPYATAPKHTTAANPTPSGLSDRRPAAHAPAAIVQNPTATPPATTTQPNLMKMSTTVVVTPPAPRPATAQIPATTTVPQPPYATAPKHTTAANPTPSGLSIPASLPAGVAAPVPGIRQPLSPFASLNKPQTAPQATVPQKNASAATVQLPTTTPLTAAAPKTGNLPNTYQTQPRAALPAPAPFRTATPPASVPNSPYNQAKSITSPSVPQPSTAQQAEAKPTMMERFRGLFGGSAKLPTPPVAAKKVDAKSPLLAAGPQAPVNLPNAVKSPALPQPTNSVPNAVKTPVLTQPTKSPSTPPVARSTEPLTKPGASLATAGLPKTGAALNDPLIAMPPVSRMPTAPGMPGLASTKSPGSTAQSPPKALKLPPVPSAPIVGSIAAARPKPFDVTTPPNLGIQQASAARIVTPSSAAPKPPGSAAVKPPSSTNPVASVPRAFPVETSQGATTLLKDVTIQPVKVADGGKNPSYNTPPALPGRTEPKTAGKSQSEEVGPLARLFGMHGSSNKSTAHDSPAKQLADALPPIKPLAADLPRKSLSIPSDGPGRVDLFANTKVVSGSQPPGLDRATGGLPNKNAAPPPTNNAAIASLKGTSEVSRPVMPSVSGSSGKSNSLNDLFEQMKGGPSSSSSSPVTPTAPVAVAESAPPAPLWPETTAVAEKKPAATSKGLPAGLSPEKTGTNNSPGRIDFTAPPALVKDMPRKDPPSSLPDFAKKPEIKAPAMPKQIVSADDATLMSLMKPPTPPSSTKSQATSTARAIPALPREEPNPSFVQRFQDMFGSQKTPAARELADAGPRIAQFPTGEPTRESPPKAPASFPLNGTGEISQASAPANKKEAIKQASWDDGLPPGSGNEVKPALHTADKSASPDTITPASAESVSTFAKVMKAASIDTDLPPVDPVRPASTEPVAEAKKPSAEEPQRTPFSTSLMQSDTTAPPRSVPAVAERKPAAIPESSGTAFTPIYPKRPVKTTPVVKAKPPEELPPEAPDERDTNWRDSWGRTPAPSAALPGKTTVEQTRRPADNGQNTQPISVTANPHYPDPLMNPEQFRQSKAHSSAAAPPVSAEAIEAEKNVPPANLQPAPQPMPAGLLRVSHQGPPVSGNGPFADGGPSGRGSSFHPTAKRGLLHRMRDNSNTGSPVQQPQLPPDQFASLPPGAQSVAAAGSGFAPKYVPVPIMTMPAARPPAPPQPSIPEPPDPAMYVNAFSQPMPPAAQQPQQPVGPAFNAFPQQMPRQMPPGYPQQYGQMPMPPNMYGQMPMNPQMMQAAYQPGQPPQGYAMQPNYPTRPQLQYNVPTTYQGPTAPNPGQQMEIYQMQQMQMQMWQQMQMQMQMQQQGQMPPNMQNPTMDRPGQAQTRDSSTSADHIAVLKSSQFPAEREWAASNLTTFDWRKQPEILEAMLQSAQQDPAPSVRAAAIMNIARKGVNSAAVLSALEALKSDVDPRVRHQATLALGQMQTLDAGPPSGITQAN